MISHTAFSSDRYGIFGCPTTGFRVVIARAEPGQLSIRVIQTASESKRLEAGVAVVGDEAKLIVVDLLQNGTGCAVDHKTRASQMRRKQRVLGGNVTHRL